MVPSICFAPSDDALTPSEVAHSTACCGQVVVVAGIKLGDFCSEVINFISYGISVGVSIVPLVVTAFFASTLLCYFRFVTSSTLTAPFSDLLQV